MDVGLSGRYQVWIRDHDGVAQVLLDDEGGFESLNYVVAVNGRGAHGWGSCRLQLASRIDELSQHFRLDYFVEVRRRYSGGDWYIDWEGFHRTHEYFYGSDQKERFVSVAEDLKGILRRPIILPATDRAFFTVTDEFADIMRELVRYQMGASAIDPTRRFSNFEVEPDTDQGASYQRDVRHVKLFEELELQSELGADFDVERSGGTLTFKVYFPRKGTDRRYGNPEGNAAVTFALNLDNMQAPRIIEDRLTEITIAYVAGEGIGSAREIVERASLWDAQYDSPWNRIEAFLEGSQSASTAALNAAGDAYLVGSRKIISFSIGAIPTAECLYGRDWVTGDLVTGRYRGTNYDLRIVETHVVVDRGRGELITPTFLHLPEELL